MLLVSIMLIGIFSFSFAISLSMDSITIRNTGLISIPIPTNITATSGSAQDIQAAVDQVVAFGGIGNVYIPEGTFNFVEVGEPWMAVEIPAGVNLFGASTERDANGQVVDWKTVLIMPWDVPGTWGVGNYPLWFEIIGSGYQARPSRFSDIKLVGYRTIDPNSTTMHMALRINNVVDFRVDHSNFEHTTLGLHVWGLYSRGVFDHCRFINYYGFDRLVNYNEGNIGYGINPGRDYMNYDPIVPTMSVLGNYIDGSVFIEDNYFSKWRHCVSPGHGSHYVFRYNTIENDFGHWSLDVHGLRDNGPDRWGTRCAEFYENTLINAVPGDFDAILQNGGGCGVWFNNYIDTSYVPLGIKLYVEDTVPSEDWHVEDFYLWSSLGPWVSAWSGIPAGFTADRNVYADWSRPAYDLSNPSYPNVDPSWSIAGYEPYPYPHPLTLESPP